MTLPEACSIAQVSTHSGRGDGARFMKNGSPVGAVGVALHDHRPVGEVRQAHVRDVGVVLQEIALAQPERRPERLVEVREPDLAVGDPDEDSLPAGICSRPGRAARRLDVAPSRGAAA